MATKWRPAEAFPPGDFLREELEERGWTQDDLATIMGYGYGTVNEIIGGKRSVTPDTAKALAAALGTTAQFWLNLESSYQLWRSESDESDAVARRARLYTIAPIKDMIRRGWIQPSDDIDALEVQVKSFLQMEDLDDTPTFAHAAWKSTPYKHVTNSQLAWLFRALHLSRYVTVDRYVQNRRSLNRLLDRLRSLMYSPQEIRLVPRILGEAGIRFVIVQHLPGTKIDGATFWGDDGPVIAMSIRYDRIDNFWFTLLHEMGHVAQGNSSIDVDIDIAEPESESENEANNFAAEQALSQAELLSFINRVGPLYRTERIEGFAELHGIHAGIVVGQLHHRGQVQYSNFRRLLEPIRAYVTEGAVVDGWGMTFPADIRR